jgi:adenine-specific DNA-methyltransferase
LKVLCDEVFGAENFVANFIWKKRTGSNDAQNMASTDHDYVISYSKNPSIFSLNGEGKDFSSYVNVNDDPKGPWMKDNLTCNKTAAERPNLYYPITDPKTGNVYQCNPNRVWAYEKNRMSQIIENGKVIFPKNGIGSPAYKRHLSELKSDKNPFSSILDVPINTIATRELRQIMDGHFFDFPKSVGLVSKLILQGVSDSDSIVMDFFAGSGTTAHAVMALNIEDGGNRQSISVQMPEVLDEDSEAYKAGYRTIADITRARIAKVIAKLKAEHPDNTTDLACAHFTLAPSSFKVWRGDVAGEEALREQLALFQTAEKPGAQNAQGGAAGGKAGSEHQAMLAELLLKHGLGALGVHAISQSVEVAGAVVYSVPMPDNKAMLLCFAPYTPAIKEHIIHAAPARVVMLNSCFVGSKADELLANLQLELAGLEIGLTVI